MQNYLHSKIKSVAVIIFTATVLIHSAYADYWVQKASFGGAVRSDATGFAIGNQGFIGTGYANGYSTDFWKYDQATNLWSQVASFGGNAGVEMSAFVIGNLGYVLPAPSGTDFWQYNPGLNTWTQKATFTGGQRQAAVGFTINNKGYITTGYGSSYFNDLWEYDATANSWTQKTNFAGAARFYAAGFSLGNKGYVGTGTSSGSTYMNDFWEWDAAGNNWTQKANVPGNPRYESVGFSLGSFGYICGGYDIQADDDLYMYDPLSNTWTPKASFGGGPRVEAVAFSIGSYAYLGTGWDGTNFRNDFWEYHSDSLTSVMDVTFSETDIRIYPNPAIESAMVALDHSINLEEARYRLFDRNGKLLADQKISDYTFSIENRNYATGEYSVVISSGNRDIGRKKIVFIHP